jgi:N-acetylmuramoyl-L-alanine amidase
MRRASRALLAIALAGAASAPARAAATVELGGGLHGRLDPAVPRFVVAAVAKSGEGWWALAQRATGRPSAWAEIRDYNRAGAALAMGQECQIPPGLWPAGMAERLVPALMPKDRVEAGGWRHVVSDGATLGRIESPWSIATLFTGSGANHARLSSTAAAARRALRPGDVVLIPRELLLPHLRPTVAAAPPATAAPAPVPVAAAGSAPPAPAADAPPYGRDVAAQAAPGTPPPADVPEGDSRPAVLMADPGLPPSGALAASGAEAAEQVPGTPPVETPGAPPVEAAVSPPEEDEEDAPPEPPPSAPKDDFEITPGTRSDDGLLTYRIDDEGPHAVYRLKAGETLYTHVVLRFTGLLSGKDVNAAALRFARRSGIADVTDIAVGASIRIPLADLTPAHLPPGHPQRLELERARAQSEKLAHREKRKNLEGVHVFLDTGHGGSDPGAGADHVWEDDYAYDIACRMKGFLEERTHATVHPLVKDSSSGFVPVSRPQRDTDEVLLTTPALRLDNGWPTKVAVNMRWVLSNAWRRRLMSRGVPDERMVFVSIHADSLHPSAEGTMVYYPMGKLRPARFSTPTGHPYHLFAEAVPQSAFSMTPQTRLRAEGLSRHAAEAILARVGSSDLAVHGFNPARGYIMRPRAVVPAVLRHNRVPASVLVEAANLNNPDDQRRLRDPAYRQRFAEAVALGLQDYFEGRRADRAVKTAAR